MTGTALGLILAAAWMHATWNLLAKRAHGGAVFVGLQASVSLVIYFPWAAWSLSAARHAWGMAEFMALGATAGLHVLYFLTLHSAYRAGDLGIAYPLARASGPVLASAGAVAFFQERMSALGIAGTALIVAGISLLMFAPRRGASINGAVWIWGLACGTCIASYTLWDAYAVRALGISPVVVNYASAAGQVLVLAPFIFRQRAEFKRIRQDHLWDVLGVGLLAPLAYILVLFAMRLSPVSVIAPAREISCLFAVFLGAKFLSEGDVARRCLAAGLSVAGILLLALES